MQRPPPPSNMQRPPPPQTLYSQRPQMAQQQQQRPPPPNNNQQRPPMQQQMLNPQARPMPQQGMMNMQAQRPPPQMGMPQQQQQQQPPNMQQQQPGMMRPPPHGMLPQSMPPQGMPPQGMAPQGMPPQGMPPQGMPPQGMPPQSMQRPPMAPQGMQGPPQGMQSPPLQNMQGPPQGYSMQQQLPQMQGPPQGMPPQMQQPPIQPISSNVSSARSKRPPISQTSMQQPSQQFPPPQMPMHNSNAPMSPSYQQPPPPQNAYMSPNQGNMPPSGFPPQNTNVPPHGQPNFNNNQMIPGMPPPQPGFPPQMYGNAPPQPMMQQQPPVFGSSQNFSGQGSGVNTPYGSNQNLAGQSGRLRIDPNQVPSPIAVLEADQELYKTKPYVTSIRDLPPLTGSDFRAVDEGNSSPRFVRLTAYSIPHTDDMAQATNGIPLGIVVQPMAELRPDEAPVPVVDYGETGPIRCNRCKAYINPHVVFTQGGRKFVCNICTYENDVPQEYFCNLDMNGRRVDLGSRPELRFGSVDFIANKEYYVRKPNPPSYLFAIDVSFASVQSGMLMQTCDAIRGILDAFAPGFSPDDPQSAGPTMCQIGIMTYDRSIQFYNLAKGLDQPQMMVVGDIEDPFVPLQNGFLVNPTANREIILQLLDQIPIIFKDSKINESAMGSAATAASIALKGFGGKIIMFQNILPTIGPGKLSSREDPKLYGTDKERTLLAPQNDFYQKLAVDMINEGISVDIFACGNAYMDIASIGVLSTMTGGELYYYPSFDPHKDDLKMAMDLYRNISRTFGYDAVMRVRVGNGLQVFDHYGNFHMRNGTDVELAWIDCDSSFAIALKHDGKLDEKLDTYIQCAMLYTTALGERRIRVLNLSVGVTNLVAQVFRYADIEASIAMIAKSVVSQTATNSLKTVCAQMTKKSSRILAAYRKQCGTTSSHAQLVLPESFKLSPIYTLCLLKNAAFRAGADITSDRRVFMMRYLKGLSVQSTMVLLYPRLLALHNIGPEVGSVNNEHGFINMPPLVRPSYERLEDHGLYLIENGVKAFLWIGYNADPNLLRDVFGATTIENVDINQTFPSQDNPTIHQLSSIISHVQSQRARFMPIVIVRQQLDQLEHQFKELLVEDVNNENQSYVDYLCSVHHDIQQAAETKLDLVLSLCTSFMPSQIKSKITYEGITRK